MALPPLAPVSALEVRLGLAPGALSGADLARAETALVDVSVLVRAEAGTNWVDESNVSTAPDPAVTVAIQAALRAYRNPENYTGENVGDYGYQTQTVGLYLTADEVRIVKAAATAATGRMTTTGSVRTPSPYAPPESSRAFWGLE